MICIAAFDPGSTTGAFAILYPDHPSGIYPLSVLDIPSADGQVDAPSLTRLLKTYGPTHAVIERVSSMPKQGVASTFKFGVAYGIIQGVVGALNIPVQFVTPTKWKKHFGLSADKEESRARALQLWPSRSELFARKKDHGRAEAALLALYFAETL